MSLGSLCSGFGGLDIAAAGVFAAELAWWSDIDPGAVAVMEHHHPGLPNIGDITRADWASIPPVDVITAGYPCQPFSNAGPRKGADDARNLWPFIAQAISVLRPQFAVLENVPGHLRRGFDRVCADLAELGYDTTWTLIRASDIGAAHQRRRLFALAWPYTAAAAVAADTAGARRGPAGSIRSGPPPRPGTSGQPAGCGERGGQAPAHPDGLGCEELHPPHPGRRPSLPDAVLRLLPTPRATDGEKGGPNQRGSSGDPMLPTVVHRLTGGNTNRPFAGGNAA